jgi:2-oxoglutarate ferredoxin oxidoreductase subunit beta
MGTVDRPFDPVQFALGCNATFVARTIDTHQKHLMDTLEAAAKHKGAAFVEIYQNCVIFNDAFLDHVTAKSVRDDKTVDLRPGEPLVFGKQHDKGVRIEAMETQVVSPDRATTWDPTTATAGAAFLLSEMDRDPQKPRPIGIFRSVQASSFDHAVNAQIAKAIEKRGAGTIRDLVYAGDMWDVR